MDGPEAIGIECGLLARARAKGQAFDKPPIRSDGSLTSGFGLTG
jgi:hypothetical protein